jgi:RimJ/RimL family protein N-acetyltransferase
MNPLDELQTPRLLLHRLRAEHLDDLTRMHADPQVMATLGGVRTPEMSAQFLNTELAHWEKHGFGLWLVRDRETGCFAGRGGLRHVTIAERDEIEVGYAFLPEFWGRGLATELARESVRVAFTELRLPEIVCFTLPTNRASQRVMEKVGFRYERDTVYKQFPTVLYRLTAPSVGPA